MVEHDGLSPTGGLPWKGGRAIRYGVGVGKQEAFSNEIKERYLGKPLWKYALMFAIFFIVAEVLLIRFMK